MQPGPSNAITDVAGVRVGHVTVIRDEPDPPAGRGIARTGVTAILPGNVSRTSPVRAGAAVLNGAGELTGYLQVSEWGLIETPVYLTSTMAVGRVYDGAVDAAVAVDPTVGVGGVVIPVVGECDDSCLNDARTVQIQAADAGRAVAAAAAGPIPEGCVGAGTGMTLFDWKGGIGTASRFDPDTGATLGVLVLANFGSAADLRIDGVPLTPELVAATEPRQPAGSCIAVVLTDAPLGTAALGRLARRCGLGLARTGSMAHHGSGEIFLTLSTAPVEQPGVPLDGLFQACVEATEEAVVNALWAATDMTGRDGSVFRALPHEPVLELLRAAGRLS